MWSRSLNLRCLPLLLLLIASTGCTETSESEADDVADTPVPIAYPYPASPDTLQVGLLFTFGGGVDDETALGLVTDASISKDGFVFILDRGFRKVYVLTPDGELLRSFGRQGQGPGEFDTPVSISVRQSHIFVLDARLRRILVFDREGTFLDSHQLDIPLSSVAEIQAIGPNVVLLSRGSTDTQGDLKLEHYRLDRANLTAGTRTTILERRIPIRDAIRLAGATTWLLRPYAVRFLWGWSEVLESVVTGVPNEDFSFSSHNPEDGHMLGRVVVHKPPRVVSAQDRDRTTEAWLHLAQGPSGEAMAAHLRFPAVKPFYSEVIPDQTSRVIWFEEFVTPERRANSPARTYDLVDLGKGVVATCRTPYPVQLIAGDRALSYWQDPDQGDIVYVFEIGSRQRIQ